MAGGSVQNLKSTCDKSIFSQQRTKNMGWIWNHFNQLNLKTMSDWVLKLNYGHLQRPKRIVLVLRKTKVFALQKTLKKSKSPYGVTGAFCQIIFVLRKNKYFFGSPKILVKPKCPYEHSCSSAQFWRHPKNALQKYRLINSSE